MIGVGLILLGISALLGLLWPAPLGQAGVPGVEVTKPPWMFLWLYPLENLVGVAGLLVLPGVLFGLLALIPLVDRGPYISPRRRWLLIAIVGVLLLLAVGLGIYASESGRCCQRAILPILHRAKWRCCWEARTAILNIVNRRSETHLFACTPVGQRALSSGG